MKYILSTKALTAITNTPGLKQKLALNLSLSENSINRILRENSLQPNHDLTKRVALDTIVGNSNLKEEDLLLDVSESKSRKQRMALQ